MTQFEYNTEYTLKRAKSGVDSGEYRVRQGSRMTIGTRLLQVITIAVNTLSNVAESAVLDECLNAQRSNVPHTYSPGLLALSE